MRSWKTIYVQHHWRAYVNGYRHKVYHPHELEVGTRVIKIYNNSNWLLAAIYWLELWLFVENPNNGCADVSDRRFFTIEDGFSYSGSTVINVAIIFSFLVCSILRNNIWWLLPTSSYEMQDIRSKQGNGYINMPHVFSCDGNVISIFKVDA